MACGEMIGSVSNRSLQTETKSSEHKIQRSFLDTVTGSCVRELREPRAKALEEGRVV